MSEQTSHLTMAELVAQLSDRPRKTDRDLALDPDFISRTLAELDKSGPSEIGDVIHSLVWRSNLLEARANRFAKEISRFAQLNNSETTSNES